MNNLIKKGISFAIIVLFIVVIVAPIVSGNITKPIRGVENLWEHLENIRYPPRPKDNVRMQKHAFESITQEYINTENRDFSFSNWTFYSTDDVSINRMYPNSNGGSLNRMYVSSINEYWDQDALIKFNISSVPQGTRVVATLYLYLNKEGGSAGREYNVYRITSDWDEMSVTWNTQPSRASSPSVTAKVPSSAGIWMDFDVTDDVQDFINGVVDNYGWLISDDDFEDFINSEFLTKENGNFIPYLDIREPVTVYVDDDNTAGPWLGTLEYPFQYIQDAVDSVHHGDNIYVFNGTYNENVRINKRIALIGENKESTIILGEGIEDVIHVSNFGVNISGFTIQGGENGWYYAGIRIETDYCNIFDNILKNNEVGINLWHFSRHNKVFNNTVNHNNYQGIYANLGGHNVIINNTVNNEYIGINVRGSYYIVGGYNVVSGNIVSNNTYGILLDETRNNEVRDNTVTYNYYGIDIIDMCIDNTVSGNIVGNNEVGIILYHAGMEYEPQPNIIVGNIITDNYCGLWIEKTGTGSWC